MAPVEVASPSSFEFAIQRELRHAHRPALNSRRMAGYLAAPVRFQDAFPACADRPVSSDAVEPRRVDGGGRYAFFNARTKHVPAISPRWMPTNTTSSRSRRRPPRRRSPRRLAATICCGGAFAARAMAAVVARQLGLSVQDFVNCSDGVASSSNQGRACRGTASARQNGRPVCERAQASLSTRNHASRMQHRGEVKVWNNFARAALRDAARGCRLWAANAVLARFSGEPFVAHGRAVRRSRSQN